MSGFTGFFMFFLSFLPLWVSVLFLDFKSILEKNPYTYTEKVSIVLIMLTFLVSFLVLKRILNPYDSGGSSVYTIHSASEDKTLTSEFFLVPSSIMRKFVYKSGRTPSAQGRETCP